MSTFLRNKTISKTTPLRGKNLQRNWRFKIEQHYYDIAILILGQTYLFTSSRLDSTKQMLKWGETSGDDTLTYL